MKPEERYRHHRKLIERYLLRFITQRKPVTLYDPSKYVLKGGGKRIRPVLTLLACETVGGDSKAALHAGAGIEILHNFTLVHDDIMDHSPTRRGRETVHTRWDTNIAILSGDVLLALAYRALLRTNSPQIQEIARIFTESVAIVCEGQALDKEFETRRRVHVNEYLEMIEKKTGMLISAATEIGAVVGGGSPSEREALRSYGLLVGRAFQVQDDLLDIVADEKTFGKAIGGDLVEGKKTFLLLEGHRLAKGPDKRTLETVLRNGGVPRSQVPTFRRIYEETGAIASAERHIAQDLAAAKAKLDQLRASEARTTLFWLTDRLLHRTF
jgi:geranylgeranyl diphosphate synthase type II